MRMLYCCVALVLVCSCASVTSQAQNLVANPGFETGQPIYNPGTPAQGSQNNMWFTNEAMPDSQDDLVGHRRSGRIPAATAPWPWPARRPPPTATPSDCARPTSHCCRTAPTTCRSITRRKGPGG